MVGISPLEEGASLRVDRPLAGRRPTQAQRREHTRTSVLAAAAKVFARRGFHAASVEEIADAAGVSKGSVYYSFESKDDLFMALLEQRVDAWLEAVRETSDQATLQGQASQAISGYFTSLNSDPTWTPLFMEFLAHSAREPRARKLMGERFFLAMRSVVADEFDRRTAAAGVPLTVARDDLAAGVNALACGLAIGSLFTSDDAPSEVMTTMVGLLLRGLVARAQDER